MVQSECQRCRQVAAVPPGVRSRGFFMAAMNRVIFLVDGFNLYHSLVEAQDDSGGRCVKWLDLRRLCLSCLDKVRAFVGDRTALGDIHYFSAPPIHCPEGTQRRHRLYMKCLRSASIHVHLGRFKVKRVKCHLCGQECRHHEEKETDVAIAAKLFELCHQGAADSFVLVTGDTDLAPAVRTCRRLFPEVPIFFAFPYRRANAELKLLSHGSIKLTRDNYLANQYPDPVPLPDGTAVSKPPEWA
jgi:hypothetical protein